MPFPSLHAVAFSTAMWLKGEVFATWLEKNWHQPKVPAIAIPPILSIFSLY